MSRRDLLATAAVAAGALAAAPSVLAEPGAAGAFGSPVVELYVPAGVLTPEQRRALIRGITDVVYGAMKQTPDPANKLYVQILETPAGGYGINGEVYVPRAR